MIINNLLARIRESLLVILLLFTFHSFSQTVSGIVLDNVSKEPLIGASVYFDGTTIGTITNEEGKFTLNAGKKITSLLIVSYIGYNDSMIENPWDLDEIKISLIPKAVPLNEVVLTADPFSRKQKMRAFREQFLGGTRAGRSCKILNEDAIHLYFDVTKNELNVDADEAIIIENSYLGYTVRFRLNECLISYYSKSLDREESKFVFYSGTSFFTDKQPGNDTYKKRRQKVYKGSSFHLMRTIAGENWLSEDFEFYKGKYKTDPRKHFTITDSLNLKKVTISNRLNILYKRKKQSKMVPRYSYYFIDELGNFYPPDAVSFSGNMGEQRTGDLLPLDYNLK